jgi:hypothetical protein
MRGVMGGVICVICTTEAWSRGGRMLIIYQFPPLISSPTPISRRRKDKRSVAAVAEGESFNENMRSEQITSPFLIEYRVSHQRDASGAEDRGGQARKSNQLPQVALRAATGTIVKKYHGPRGGDDVACWEFLKHLDPKVLECKRQPIALSTHLAILIGLKMCRGLR